jgi:uncharacterized protein (DUF2062 family)
LLASAGINIAMNPAALIRIWRERIAALIVSQLLQGVTPQKIALTIALGFCLGIIPILGITTALCAIAAVRLKLNQPIIQLVNWMVYPLQLALVLVFIRIGEWILHVPLISFSLPQLLEKFRESPGKFFAEFGMCGVHGVIAWLLIAPFLAAITYVVLLPLLKKLATIKISIPAPPAVE